MHAITTIREAHAVARPAARSAAAASLVAWRVLLGAACVAILLATPLPQVDSDTALFGKTALNILSTGDWVTLHYPVHPEVIVEKPPLTFWIMAISLWLGGATDAALRLWHLLATLALLLVVYRIARLDLDEEPALLAALCMATFQQVFYYSMAPKHDVPVTLFLSLALYAYLRYRRSATAVWAASAGFWTGLAVLTKGVLFLPAFAGIALIDAVLARRSGHRPGFRFRHLATGAGVCILVAAPWYVAEAVRLGSPFVSTLLLTSDSIGRLQHRFLGPGLVPLHDVVSQTLAYIPMLMVGMLPWTGLLPAALAEGWRGIRGGSGVVRLSAVWFVLIFAVVSLSQGDRIIRYLYPCYPPLAILAGRSLAEALHGRGHLRTASVLSLLLGLPMMIAAVWLVWRSPDPAVTYYLPILFPTLALFSATIMAFAWLAVCGRVRHAIVCTAVGALVAYATGYAMLWQRWEQLWPWRAIAAAANRASDAGQPVMMLGLHPAETNFAAFWLRQPVREVDPATLAAAWRRGRAVALLAPDAPADLRQRLRPRILVRTPLGWELVTNR